MYVDPLLRGRAARVLLDAVSSLKEEDAGKDSQDEMTLLALDDLGLDIRNGSPELKAATAAAVEMLWFMTLHSAQQAGVTHEAVISNFREHVLPIVYPESFPGT